MVRACRPPFATPLPVAFHTTLHVGVRCRVCLARWSKTSPQKAWLCTIANREYPSLPLLLLWLTIDRVACGQVCFGGGHFELVPAGRM